MFPSGPDRYAVIGNPVAHSKSPLIHAAFARALGEVLEYGRLLADPAHFEDEVRGFFAAGGRGLNVTVPFKERAWALADEHGPAAAACGAVNTLKPLQGGGLWGDNTDGIGLVRDLQDNHGFDFTGRWVLLLGAGGAVRGVLRPLLDTGLARLTLANRTAARALELARSAADLGPVQGCGLGELAGQSFDLIVNGTSAGLFGEVPPLPPGCLAAGGWTYDMLYADTPTAFCCWGQAQGAVRALDGLGMLVEQAAESYRLWRGQRPPTAGVVALLRQSR